MNKKLNIEDLDRALSDYRLFKSKADRLQTDVLIKKGQLEQLYKELEEAQNLLDKEKRKIYSVVEDLYTNESKLKF